MNPDEIDAVIWHTGEAPRFAPTTPAERQAVSVLVPAMLRASRGAVPADLVGWQRAAVAAGLRMEVWRVGGEAFWALVEPAGQRRGAGAYVVRASLPAASGGAPEVILEAPHAYYDVGTGIIAGTWFFHPTGAVRPRAFFTNTVHRYWTESGNRVRRRDSPADVAHNPEHLFQAATEAALGELSGAGGAPVVLVQLHGFSDERVVDDDAEDGAAEPAGPPPTVVVSSGRREGAQPAARAVAAALSASFGDGVRLYPDQVQAFGATTNVQGRLVGSHPGAEFVHVETATSLRRALRNDPSALARFGAALLDAAGAPRREP